MLAARQLQLPAPNETDRLRVPVTYPNSEQCRLSEEGRLFTQLLFAHVGIRHGVHFQGEPNLTH